MSIRTSENLDKLAPALLRAQRAMENVAFDSQNPHFRNKYAGLPGVLMEVKTKLNAEGIAILQFPSPADEGHLGLTTRLQHESGQFIEATANPPLPKSDPQGYGSAMTYTRRYAALSAMGLVGEEDDDANAASGAARPAGNVKPAPTGGVFGKRPEAKPDQAKAPEKKKAGLFPTPATKRNGPLNDKPPAAAKGEESGEE